MPRYFLHFAYDGEMYHGFQVQPNGNTVQAEMERALSTILRQEVEVVGAGRTDAGVHARHMVAHIDLDQEADPQQLTYRLNKLLPSDIAVWRVERVSNETHARFSAHARTYHYYIHTKKDPFLRRCSMEVHYPLDFGLMNQAAAMLLETTDFASFCKSHSDVQTTLCQVTEAHWIQTSPHTWYFRITANRFLRNMVRAIVGTLIDVGRGAMTLEEFAQVIASGKRTDAGESVVGFALFLEKVEY